MFAELYARTQKHGWLLAGLAWIAGLLIFGLLRTDSYGIDENGARSLLLTWTVWENVTTPIVTLGPPDLRSLVFIPLGAYWPGSMLAAKVFTAILTFIAIFGFYRVVADTVSDEAALLASGLALIAPLTLLEINQLGAGPHLLLAFSVGLWAHRRYLDGNRPLGGWFFLLLFLVLYAVSLHPAGLALPAALAWEWWRYPRDARQQKHFFFGLGLATLITLAFRYGWPGLVWLDNPLDPLSTLWVAKLPDAIEPTSSLFGLFAAILAVTAIIAAWPVIARELWARLLFGASLLGLIAADSSWAFIVQSLILLLGLTALIQLSKRITGQGFAKQRGAVLATVFVIALVFMIGDKNYREANIREARSPQDQILYVLALEVADRDERIPIASQWPARTLLATKQPSFPLPPPQIPDMTGALKHVNYVAFDPFIPANQSIREAIAQSSPTFETAMIEDRAVLIKVRGKHGSSPSSIAVSEPAADSKPSAVVSEQDSVTASPPS